MTELRVNLVGPGARIALRAAKRAEDAVESLGDYVTSAQLTTGLAGKVATTLTISAGTGITGGGSLAANRTFALSAGTIASLGKADTALQPAALAAYVTTSALGAALGGYATSSALTAGLAGKAASSRTITAGTGLTGGGDLTGNRTFALSAGSIASLAKADTAVQPSAFTPVAQAVVDNQPRPGDAPARFTSTLIGAPVAGADAPGVTGVTDQDGSVRLITGAGILATREAFGLVAAHTYKVRAIVRRVTDPSDPIGTTVRVAVQWLNKNKAAVSQRVIQDTTLSVADGTLVVEMDFSGSGAAGVVSWPSSARYMRLFVQTYGSDGVTGIIVLERKDITDAGASVTPPLNNYQLWLADGNEGTLEEYLVFAENQEGPVLAAKLAAEAARDEAIEVLTDVQDDLNSFFDYSATGPAYDPLWVSAEGQMLIGAKISDGSPAGTVLDFLPRKTDIELLGEFMDYTGPNTVDVLWVSPDGGINIGWNHTENRPVGAVIDALGSAGYPPADLVPLVAGYVPALAEINLSASSGQSLDLGAAGVPVLTETQPYLNLMHNAGIKATKSGSTGSNPGQASLVPLIEDMGAADGGSNRGETGFATLCNHVTEAGIVDYGMAPANLVLMATAAGRGDTVIALLQIDQSWGTVWKDQVTSAKARATALGKTLAVFVTPWRQGEADVSAATTYATYKAALIKFATDTAAYAMTATGQAFKPTMLTYQVPAVGTGEVPQAQVDAALENDGIALSTPLYHLPSADGTHLTAIGYKRLGHAEGRAAAQILLGHKKPAWLKPGNAWARGRHIYWRWAAPQKPLRLDNVNLPPTKDYGFAVTFDGVATTIVKVEIINGDTVYIEVGADPTGAVAVAYARHYMGTGTSWGSVQRSGNLRDSTPDTCFVEGVTYPLFHVAPSYSRTVTILGLE